MKKGDFMSKKADKKPEDHEIRYMIMDDTIDIGKEPLPIESEEDKALLEYAKRLLKECTKEK